MNQYNIKKKLLVKMFNHFSVVNFGFETPVV